MKNVNKVQLLGHVTHDPELHSTPGGHSITTFRLATNRVWKDANGVKQDLAEFHNIVARGKLAEFCEQNIKKGQRVYIEGPLKTRTWEHEGIKMAQTEIVAENIVLLGSEADIDRESPPHNPEVNA